jgi:glucosamine 6-phosphate synthetase-like amidotransferase/phosphosugar isomerase protein
MCGIVAYFGGAGNNLTRVLTAMAAIVYRAPDSTGIGVFGDDREPVRLRKAVGAVAELLETLQRNPIYPCPEQDLAALGQTPQGRVDQRRLQRRILALESLASDALDGLEAGQATDLRFDALVELDAPAAVRLAAGCPGSAGPPPIFRIRRQKDLPELIRHLIVGYDLSPLTIRYLIRDSLEKALGAAEAADLLAVFDRVFDITLAEQRIPRAGQMTAGGLPIAADTYRAFWRQLAKVRIQLPDDYDRDAVRCLFRLLDAVLLSRLPGQPELAEQIETVFDQHWPPQMRSRPLAWRPLYSAEKGANLFGRAAAAALAFLQQTELPLPAAGHLPAMPVDVVPGQTDPYTLRYLAAPIILHGRWAIQSAVTVKNAHPFTDAHRQRVLVLNGQFDSQVEAEVRRYLGNVAGTRFRSDNSAEYLAQLWGVYFDQLLDEQRRGDLIRKQVDEGLDTMGIGSQAVDFATHRQVNGRSMQELDQLALVAAVRQMIRDGGQIAVAAMSNRSPRTLYVASHNRPVFLVRRMDNDDVMVVSDVNAAMGLFPQELLTTTRQALLELDRTRAADKKKGRPDDEYRRRRRSLMAPFQVSVTALDGAQVFACIQTVLDAIGVHRRITFSDFDGQPLSGIDDFVTTLDPAQVRKDLDRSFHETHLLEIPQRLATLLQYYHDREDRLRFGIRAKQLRARFGRDFSRLQRLVLLGAGSAGHMAALGRPVLETLLPGIDLIVLRPGEVDDLSRAILPDRDLVVLLSWSGTTADMVQAAGQLLAIGAVTVGITEKTFADMALLVSKSGGVIATLSGEEVTVTGLKSTVCLLFCLLLLAAWTALQRGRAAAAEAFMEPLRMLPAELDRMVTDHRLRRQIAELAADQAGSRVVVVIDALDPAGVGPEAGLKLEENSWSLVAKVLDYGDVGEASILAGYEGAFVLVNATRHERMAESLAVMALLNARRIGYSVVTTASRLQDRIRDLSGGRCILLPRLHNGLQVFGELIFYYQLAYDLGRSHGRADGAMPRNRAKSLTITRSWGQAALSPAAELAMVDSRTPVGSGRAATTPTAWLEASLEGSEETCCRELAALARALSAGQVIDTAFDGHRSIAERLATHLFGEESDVVEMVFIPMDRRAEAAVHNVIDLWQPLWDLPMRILPAGAKAIQASSATLSVVVASRTVSPALWPPPIKAGAPWVFAGLSPSSDALVDLSGDPILLPLRSERVALADLVLTAGLNELFLAAWQRVLPGNADIVARHLKAGGQVVAELLDNPDLRASLVDAVHANRCYATAHYVGPPTGVGRSWTATFDAHSRVVLESYPYGFCAHGPIVTVDSQAAGKFVAIRERDRMVRRFGEDRVRRWEAAYLDGTRCDAYLSRSASDAALGPRRPFVADGQWYLPVLQPEYDTAQDNLIVLDMTHRRYWLQALDELATFGCRFPRLIVITQAELLQNVAPEVFFRFPIDSLIVLPPATSAGPPAAIPDACLPYVMGLLAHSSAAITTVSARPS